MFSNFSDQLRSQEAFVGDWLRFQGVHVYGCLCSVRVWDVRV